MSLLNLGLLWSALGLAVLATVFFLLQRLRVRHQPVVVETALFWRQAIEESRARVFVQRFRHPWTYALLLGIAALLWLGLAGPRFTDAGERDHVVLIDGSAAMAVGDRFDAAKAQALAYVAGLPIERRSVVLCQGRAQTLLRPGEELLLLAQRLADRGPAACPATVAATLRSYARLQQSTPLDVCVIGEAPLDPGEIALLSAEVRVTRLRPGAMPTDGNRGVTVLGVNAAASGRWDAVDVLVEVDAVRVADAQPQLSVDGVAVAIRPEVASTANGARYRFAELPAHGGVLEVVVAGDDALAFDDRARFVLPDRRQIRVAVEATVPAAVREVLASDPGVTLDEAAPAVVVRRGGSSFGGDLPAIEFVSTAAAEDAFLVVHPPELDPEAVLHELYEGLGLNEIDAMSLAQASRRTISMGAVPGPRRGLWIQEDLLREDYDFVHSRSFPLFLGLGVRWLVDFDEGPVRVAVGEALDVRGTSVTGPSGRVVRSLSPTFVPTAMGAFESDRGERFAASLLDPFSTTGVAVADADLPAAEIAVGPGFDLVTLILVLALLLLALEWFLYRSGRIA